MKTYAEFCEILTAAAADIDTARRAYDLADCKGRAAVRAALKDMEGTEHYATLEKVSKGFTVYVTRTKKEDEQPTAVYECGKSTFYEYKRNWFDCSVSQLQSAINGIFEMLKASKRPTAAAALTYKEMKDLATDYLVRAYTTAPELVEECARVLALVTSRSKDADAALVMLKGKFAK